MNLSHLQEAGETYFQHLSRAFILSLNLFIMLASTCIVIAVKFMLDTGRAEQLTFECIPRKRKELSARIQRTNILPMDEVKVEGKVKEDTEQKIKAQVSKLRLSMKQ